MDTVTSTLTPDDTQPAPVLMTREILPADLIHSLADLNNHLVQYRHYQDSRRMYLGRITTIIESHKTGTRDVYVEPLPGQGVSFVKPYHISTIKLAWFEVAK